MLSSSQDTPNLLHLLTTRASLSSFDGDSGHSTKRFGEEILLLSPSFPSKKIVIGDESWLKRTVSVSSEASSPERQFERQDFFSSFKIPVKFEEEREYKLQHYEKDAVNYIEPQTLYKNANNITIFDCRYQYEFDGGHINGASHLCNPYDIENIFFKQIPQVKPVVVLYCEFSEKRSVKIYKQIRSMDRNVNDYPNLHYPDLYILDRGFSNYSSLFPQHVDGQYIKMDQQGFEIQYKEQKSMNDNQWNTLRLKRRK